MSPECRSEDVTERLFALHDRSRLWRRPEGGGMGI